MRRPYVLAAVTWGYLAWSFLPVAVALGISLGWDPLTREGDLNFLAYRVALRGTGIRRAFVHSVWLALGTVLIAVPMGMALGLVLAHLSRRPWRVMRAALIGMIALPHLALGVVLFYLFIFVVRVQLNTVTQLIGHVTVALPFVALIVWTRLLFLDASYEEQAEDLGGAPVVEVDPRPASAMHAGDHRGHDGRVRRVVQRTPAEPIPVHTAGVSDDSDADLWR